MATAADEGNLSPWLILEPMPQQLGVRVSGDDWTGITSTKERRKLQNRLNQRAYKKRQETRLKRKEPAESCRAANTKDHDEDARSRVSGFLHPSEIATTLKLPHSVTLHATTLCGLEQGFPPSSNNSLSTSKSESNLVICNMDLTAIRKYMDEYESAAYRDYMLGLPRVGQLLTLVQFNVFRAFLSNTSTIGFNLEWLDGEAISPFGFPGFSRLNSMYPANLRPTHPQFTIPRHPWLDLLPAPVMRDNILLALENEWDDSDLCRDLVEFCQEPKEMTGFIIWGEPWDPSGWEVTEGFWSKWAWVIRGCPELLRSTNHWREKRGEKRLFSNTTIESY